MASRNKGKWTAPDGADRDVAARYPYNPYKPPISSGTVAAWLGGNSRRNSVPDSVSMPIPGFDEARAAAAAQYEREEERRRVIEGERRSYLRSQLMRPAVPDGLVAAARIPADAFVGGYSAGRQIYDTVSRRGFGGFADSVAGNPDPTENPDSAAALGAALVLVPGASVARRGLVAAADRVAAGSAMRPGYVRVPGRFHGAFDPAGRGKPATVRAYETAAETMRNIYKSPDARRILRTAIETGDRSNPLVKLYDKTKAELHRYRDKLNAQDSAMFRSDLRNALSGFKTDMDIGADLAKSLRSSGPGPAPAEAASGGGRLWNAVKEAPGVLWRNKGKAGLAAGVAAAGVVSYRTAGRDEGLAGGTETAKEQVAEVDRAYYSATNSAALREAMSDENALAASLRRVRDIAAWEAEKHPERKGLALANLQGYVGSVTNSPAFSSLLSRAETEYLAVAPDEGSYQEDFRKTYGGDPVSQAVGEDFWPANLIGGEQ